MMRGGEEDSLLGPGQQASGDSLDHNHGHGHPRTGQDRNSNRSNTMIFDYDNDFIESHFNTELFCVGAWVLYNSTLSQ